MKKIVLLIAVLVAGATSTYAINPVDSEVFYKLNDEATFNGLMKYLKADGEQAENLKYIFEVTESKIKAAVKNENDEASDKAVNFNLANAKNILTPYQYKKYLSIVNLTINNRYEEILLTENK